MSSFQQSQGWQTGRLAGQPSGGLWSIERVVALLTPLFAAAAGWITTEIAKLIPGLGIPRDQLVAVFIAGATAAAGAALKWLHGRQKFVNFTTDAQGVAQQLAAEVQHLMPSLALGDVERLLRSHEQNILDAVGKSIGPSAEQIAQQIVRQIWPPQPPAPQQSGAGV